MRIAEASGYAQASVQHASFPIVLVLMEKLADAFNDCPVVVRIKKVLHTFLFKISAS
jgi:hypothetical protein